MNPGGMRLDTANRANVANMSNQRPIGTSRGLGTAIRPIGTALRGDPNYVPIGLATNVKIVDRPVTNHGMVGIKQQNQGPERRIYDRTYYLNLLKTKNNELANEINKFKKQIDDINKDNATFIALEKKYEVLTKEVRKLEGKLADYNLAFDKQRAETRPEDIRNMYEHVKIQNERLKGLLDELFIERKNQEEQIAAIEAQLHEIHQTAELKLNELDPEQRSEYESLLNENRQLTQNINIQRTELEDVNSALSQAEAKLRMDHTKQKYNQLKEQLVALERKRGDLEVQTNENNLSFPEARDRLLAKVKEDNNFILNTDKRIKEIKKIIENYERQLKEMEQDFEEKKNEEQDKQKYEILYQKDQEITKFIDNFESTRRQEIEQMNSIEQNIVELLEQASRALFVPTDLPDKDQYNNLMGEFAFKSKQTEISEETLQRLQFEYQQRVNDMKNFDQLEEKMALELKNLNEKSNKMQNEINTKFDKIKQISQDSEQLKKKLLSEKEALTRSSQSIKDELIAVTYDYELKKQKMNLHEQFAPLSELEKKYSQNQSQIYFLKQYIQTKSVDMNYQHLVNDCNNLVDQVNKVILKQMGF